MKMEVEEYGMYGYLPAIKRARYRARALGETKAIIDTLSSLSQNVLAELNKEYGFLSDNEEFHNSPAPLETASEQLFALSVQLRDAAAELGDMATEWWTFEKERKEAETTEPKDTE